MRSTPEEHKKVAQVRTKVLSLGSWHALIDLIPEGLYCYSGKTKCPFWGFNPGVHNQEAGYCVLIGQMDWDKETCPQYRCVQDPKNPENVGCFYADGLLWDSVKECGVYDEPDMDEIEWHEENQDEE